MAERSGRGVDRIFEGSLQYGRALPDYNASSSTAVRLFIPRSLPDENLIRIIAEEQQRRGSALPVNSLLILNALKQGRRMTIHDLASVTHILEVKVRATVERMAESGLLEPSGSGRGRTYLLSSKLYRSKAGYVRQTDIEKIRYPELVLRLAETQGDITRNDVVELLHVSPPQAYRILQKLVKNGKLVQSGSTRNTVYRKL